MEQQNEISSSIVEQVEDGSEESSETSLIEKSSKQDERGHRAELDLHDLGFSEYFDPMSSGNFSDGSNPEEEAPTEQTILLKRIMSWGMHPNTSEGLISQRSHGCSSSGTGLDRSIPTQLRPSTNAHFQTHLTSCQAAQLTEDEHHMDEAVLQHAKKRQSLRQPLLGQMRQSLTLEVESRTKQIILETEDLHNSLLYLQQQTETPYMETENTSEQSQRYRRTRGFRVWCNQEVFEISRCLQDVIGQLEQQETQNIKLEVRTLVLRRINVLQLRTKRLIKCLGDLFPERDLNQPLSQTVERLWNCISLMLRTLSLLNLAYPLEIYSWLDSHGKLIRNTLSLEKLQGKPCFTTLKTYSPKAKSKEVVQWKYGERRKGYAGKKPLLPKRVVPTRCMRLSKGSGHSQCHGQHQRLKPSRKKEKQEGSPKTLSSLPPFQLDSMVTFHMQHLIKEFMNFIEWVEQCQCLVDKTGKKDPEQDARLRKAISQLATTLFTIQRTIQDEKSRPSSPLTEMISSQDFEMQDSLSSQSDLHNTQIRMQEITSRLDELQAALLGFQSSDSSPSSLSNMAMRPFSIPSTPEEVNIEVEEVSLSPGLGETLNEEEKEVKQKTIARFWENLMKIISRETQIVPSPELQ